MISQRTNRREGGSTSCPSHSRKLRTYIEKELETMWAAPELLGAPTIGGGSARSGGGGGGGHRSQISTPSRPKYTKMAKNRTVLRTFWLINCQKHHFLAQKYLTRYTHEMFFEEYINFKIVHNLNHCGVIPVPAAWIRVNNSYSLPCLYLFICVFS
jgi:hypothetical protein